MISSNGLGIPFRETLLFHELQVISERRSILAVCLGFCVPVDIMIFSYFVHIDEFGEASLRFLQENKTVNDETAIR